MWSKTDHGWFSGTWLFQQENLATNENINAFKNIFICWILNIQMIRVDNLVLAFDLLCKHDSIKANQMICNFNFSFFIGCNKMHKLLGYHFYPMRSKHGSYWLIFSSRTFAHWTSLICKNKLFWGQWVLKMHLIFTRKMMAGSENTQDTLVPLGVPSPQVFIPLRNNNMILARPIPIGQLLSGD